MIHTLNDLFLISPPNGDLPLWPLLCASLLASVMILRRRRSD
ncbi:MAG TPA: hypothetical protein VFM48_15870 [Aquabacterium sp.]|nr:hypothetical protein [Aquabacterium sp.]